jgi:MFS family permease
MGIGPLLAEWVTGDDAYSRTFFVAGAFAALSAITVLGVPTRVDRSSADADKQPLFNRTALWPGMVLCSGIAAFAVFMAFVPEYSKSVGLAGAGALFFTYSLVSISLRLAAAKLPERLGAHRTVTIALVSLSAGMLLVAAVAEPWALWAGTVWIGVGMAFLYPSLMANVVNRVDDNARASALSSLTLFFEAGTIVGGVVLGAVGEIFSKRAGFLGGAIAALVGVVLLWQFVTAEPTDVVGAAERGSPALAN